MSPNVGRRITLTTTGLLSDNKRSLKRLFSFLRFPEDIIFIFGLRLMNEFVTVTEQFFFFFLFLSWLRARRDSVE